MTITCVVILVYGYECDREQVSVDGPPPCHAPDVRLRCQNGGTAVYESEKCWCDCPVTWQGDHDCSKPTRDPVDLPPGSDICKLNLSKVKTQNILFYLKYLPFFYLFYIFINSSLQQLLLPYIFPGK